MVGWLVVVTVAWMWTGGCAGQQLQCGTCISGYSDLTCPDLYHKDRLIVKLSDRHDIPESVLTVTCRSQSPHLKFSLLKGCNFTSVRYVHFQYCQLPGERFSEVLEELGVEAGKVITLSFSNARQRLNMTLRPDHLHGLTSLKNIEFKANLFTELPADFLSETLSLKFFSFTFNNLNMIPETLFANTPNLTDVSLLSNGLTTLPDGLLAGLFHLSKLSLYENQLTEVRPQLLAQVPALTTLELSFNNITHLTPTLLSNLPNLTKLMLNSNRIKQLPDELLHSCPNLEYLYITHNELTSLPSILFKVSKSIKEFTFEHNKVTSLPKGLFSGLQNMTKLKLKWNSLKSFPNDSFSDLENLEVLDLQSNLLTALPPDCFLTQHKLNTLILHNNRLLELPDYIFQHCESMEKLYLSHNNLSSLLGTLFPHPTSLLQKLHLSHNNLSFTTPGPDYIVLHQYFPLSSQTSLLDLKLDNNHIRSMPRALTTLPDLANLDLSSNIIEYIDDIDLSFKSDKLVVDLRNNRIKIVALENMGAAMSGRQIQVFLSGNPLVCDCHLYHLARFMQIRLDPGDLPVVPAEDAPRVQCSWDSGVKERVEAVDTMALTCPAPDCLAPCSCITRAHDQMFIMDCSHQNLQSVPQLHSTTLPYLTTTQQLNGNYSLTINLQENNINSLVGVEKFISLVNLIVANNSLTFVNESLLPGSLRALDLRGNQLSALQVSLLKFLNATNTTLSLGGNPWVCDCDLLPLFAFLRDPARNVTDAGSMICRDLNVSLVKVLEEDLCPIIKQPLVIVTIASTTVFLFLFFILGTVSVYRYQQDIKVWLFTHRLCLWAVTEEEQDTTKKFDAFISYSNKDDEFVNSVLVPGLESGDPKYKVCLHYRDWTPGEYIHNQIDQSIEASHRTIVILSNNFIENVWGQIEFKTAHSKALKDKTNRIIVIVFGQVPPDSQLDEELKLYLSSHTYLQWGDHKFWEKLRYAMPHPQQFVHRRQQPHTDKLEMVHTNFKTIV